MVGASGSDGPLPLTRPPSRLNSRPNSPAAARPCQVEWRASSYCSKAVDAFQWLAFEADLSAASRQTFAPAPGGAVRVLRAGTLRGSARVMAHAPTATHNKVRLGVRARPRVGSNHGDA